MSGDAKLSEAQKRQLLQTLAELNRGVWFHTEADVQAIHEMAERGLVSCYAMPDGGVMAGISPLGRQSPGGSNGE